MVKNLSAREPSALGLDTYCKQYYLCLAAASATIKWYICSIHHDHDKIRLQLLWFYPVQEQQWLLKHLWVYLPWFFLQTELCFSIGILLYHPSLLNNFLFFNLNLPLDKSYTCVQISIWPYLLFWVSFHLFLQVHLLSHMNLMPNFFKFVTG